MARAAQAVAETQDAEERPGTAVAQTGGGDLTALFAEAEGLEGAGTSGAADDNIVPFMQLLQDISPQVKKRDPAYIEGAEAGLWINRATGEVFKEFDFQPCVFQRVVMEWVPRDSGGGVVARHPHKAPTIEDSLRGAGGREVPDTRDSTGRKKKWVTDSGNELIDTRYTFGHIVYPDGSLQPAVISFSSTGHQAARQFMNMQRGPTAMLPSKKPAPAWFRKYKVSSTTKSNSQGEWFVPKFDDYGQNGWIRDAGARAAGQQLYDSVSAGVMQAAQEESTDGATENDSEIPF